MSFDNSNVMEFTNYECCSNLDQVRRCVVNVCIKLVYLSLTKWQTTLEIYLVNKNIMENINIRLYFLYYL